MIDLPLFLLASVLTALGVFFLVGGNRVGAVICWTASSGLCLVVLVA